MGAKGAEQSRIVWREALFFGDEACPQHTLEHTSTLTLQNPRRCSLPEGALFS